MNGLDDNSNSFCNDLPGCFMFQDLTTSDTKNKTSCQQFDLDQLYLSKPLQANGVLCV
mgnify:CR=1 FL=1